MTVDEVWSWPSAFAALVASVLFGLYIIVIHVARPAYNGHALWATIGVDALVGAFLFSASQVIAAWLQGDTGWVRILSRFGLWVVFAIGLSVTVWAGLRWRHRSHA